MQRKEKNVEINIPQITVARITCTVLGTSPLIYNAMSEKAWQSLIYPSKAAQTRAGRQGMFKHLPMEEFHGSFYCHRGDDRPTRLRLPGAMFRQSLSATALDIPGLQKTQLGRLSWVEETAVDLYGIPQLHMHPIRLADVSRSFDIRTRGIVPKWGCQFTLRFVTPLFKATQIANLLGVAGIINGVGDWRNQKGSGTHGQYELVDETDERWVTLRETAGREAQDAAIAHPATYDDQTDRMLAWFFDEVRRRGDTLPSWSADYRMLGNGVSEDTTP